MNINTILFDLDGTLLNTNELIDASFKHTFRTYNYVFTDEEIQSFNGPPLMETFTKIDPKRAKDMIQTYRAFNIKHHDAYVELFPNVMETIQHLAEEDVQMAIVTNKSRKVVFMGLELTGLSHYFFPNRVVTLDDITHPKPHPESVIQAMKALKGVARSTLMVGDNYHDIQAGQRAGVQTAGVSWSAKGRNFLQQYNPTYMLDDMKDLLHII